MAEYQEDEMMEQGPSKSIRGYQIFIVILSVILVVVSALYFQHMKQVKQEFEIERDTLTSRLSGLMVDLDNIRTENDTISQNLVMERNRADSLMDRLKSERNMNYRKIREYESKLGNMRNLLDRYVHQLDSLNKLNQSLITENINYRKEVTSQRLRAAAAEEKAEELSTKVRQGAVVTARDINLLALNQNDKVVTRVARAARLRVDFVLSANTLAEPGSRTVYVQIQGPDGYVMATDASHTFLYEDDNIPYSAAREIDYQNQDLSVSLYYNGGGIVAGTYTIAVYLDGYLAGTAKALLR